jgi:hypothetical protein
MIVRSCTPRSRSTVAAVWRASWSRPSRTPGSLEQLLPVVPVSTRVQRSTNLVTEDPPLVNPQLSGRPSLHRLSFSVVPKQVEHRCRQRDHPAASTRPSRSLIGLAVEDDKHAGGNPIDHSRNAYDRGHSGDQIGGVRSSSWPGSQHPRGRGRREALSSFVGSLA